MVINRFMLIILAIFLSQSLSAQLFNRVFDEALLYPDTISNKRLYFNFKNLNFLRNNEYFNPVVTGETLFGNQISPSISYYPNKYVRLEAGVFLQKNFGETDYAQIQPIYTVRYQRDSSSITFGNLEANTQHGLIEPLYAFETTFRSHLEYGLQLKHKARKYKAELWVDWQAVATQRGKKQEEIWAGLVAEAKLYQKKSSSIDFALQMTVKHKGGQNLNLNIPATNAINIATGITWEWKNPNKGFARNFRTENYYLLARQEFLVDTLATQRNGDAFYANVSMQTTKGDFVVSYWLGNGFDSPTGGDLYKSYPRYPDGVYQAQRQLLFLRYSKQWVLSKGVSLVLRLEPYYDLMNKILEHSEGLYLIVNLNK